MSVEKLSDLSKTLIEQCPFTQISNSVIQGIKDNDAFRIYCYLISKSRDWTVVKQWTAKECGLGETKAKQCWSYLNRCGLIRYKQIRNATGAIINHDLVVLNGTGFNPDEPFLKSKPVDSDNKTTDVSQKHYRVKNPPGSKTTRVGKRPLLNKDITNKEIITKKRAFKAKAVDNSENIKKAKQENKQRHPWADMKNEKAAIDRHEKQKKLECSEDSRSIVRGMMALTGDPDEVNW